MYISIFVYIYIFAFQQLHLDFNAHWPGALFRISVECVDNGGGVSNNAENGGCVFVKFEGTVTCKSERLFVTFILIY